MITVAPYDPSWPALAEAEIAQLRDEMPVLRRLEHFGSTSVPGLAAKPVIDIMAVGPVLPGLSVPRYQYADAGMRNRLFYWRQGDPVRYHLHILTEELWHASNERILRDYLRSAPADAARYGELKRGLAASGLDPDSYTKAKTELIQELVDIARTRLGLPIVPVWED